MGAKTTKVFVGMSGGVDSSVSAALLKKAGYDVAGVFIRVWQPDFIECSKTDDESMARRAAARLGIPLLVFNFADEYKRKVVDYMVHEYKRGRTPNPDVMCNRQIKFGAFLKRAKELGADYIATGHYAKIRGTDAEQTRSRLFAGVDKNKDQSYFLWTLTQEQLKFILFPIGEYEKPHVRKMAREFGLPNAKRKDSQGLCFVGEFPMKEFLGHFISQKRGDVLSEKGEVIGHHDGAAFLTLGQRHGFTITKRTPNDPPRYVVGKDMSANTVTVSMLSPEMPGSVTEVELEDMNFIRGEKPDESKTYKIRYRYRQPLVEAKIAGNTIHFTEKQSGIASGQSLVIYNSSAELGMNECLGGGVIK